AEPTDLDAPARDDHRGRDVGRDALTFCQPFGNLPLNHRPDPEGRRRVGVRTRLTGFWAWDGVGTQGVYVYSATQSICMSTWAGVLESGSTPPSPTWVCMSISWVVEGTFALLTVAQCAVDRVDDVPRGPLHPDGVPQGEVR